MSSLRMDKDNRANNWRENRKGILKVKNGKASGRRGKYNIWQIQSHIWSIGKVICRWRERGKVRRKYRGKIRVKGRVKGEVSGKVKEKSSGSVQVNGIISVQGKVIGYGKDKENSQGEGIRSGEIRNSGEVRVTW